MRLENHLPQRRRQCPGRDEEKRALSVPLVQIDAETSASYNAFRINMLTRESALQSNYYVFKVQCRYPTGRNDLQV